MTDEFKSELEKAIDRQLGNNGHETNEIDMRAIGNWAYEWCKENEASIYSRRLLNEYSRIEALTKEAEALAEATKAKDDLLNEILKVMFQSGGSYRGKSAGSMNAQTIHLIREHQHNDKALTRWRRFKGEG